MQWASERRFSFQSAAGLRADLALLDRDPFAGPPEEIYQARVAATFVDGHEVFLA